MYEELVAGLLSADASKGDVSTVLKTSGSVALSHASKASKGKAILEESKSKFAPEVRHSLADTQGTSGRGRNFGCSSADYSAEVISKGSLPSDSQVNMSGTGAAWAQGNLQKLNPLQNQAFKLP